MNRQQQQIEAGRLGGLAGRGKSKSRGSEEARKAINIRWAKYRKAQTDNKGKGNQ